MKSFHLQHPAASFFDGATPVLAQKLLGCLLFRIPTQFLKENASETLHDLSTRELLALPGIRVGMICETEAYDCTDPAAHSFRGPTPGNAAMFGPAGTLYVYLIYGMYYCLNVVSQPKGIGGGTLLRGIIPLDGFREMRSGRGLTLKSLNLGRIFEKSLRTLESADSSQQAVEIISEISPSSWARFVAQLSGGPGKLTQAFNLSKQDLFNKSLIPPTNQFILTLRSPQTPLYQQKVGQEMIENTPRIGLRHSKEALLRWVIRANAVHSLTLSALRALADEPT